ncbi:MAG: hypothetical protein AABY64_05960 [Bdellovibrionota bacterium]|mgnify:FL=1
MTPDIHKILVQAVTRTISETNGVTLVDTLDLLLTSDLQQKSPAAYKLVF